MEIIYGPDFHPSIHSPVLISHAFDFIYCTSLNILLGTLLGIHSLQVAYETELSGTPTAIFPEIQLIGQFLVLGINILI